ncbi:MAG: OadG family protein [Bacteroidaceae bacterium]|nr:OadG family protein [Bacteroidaceae bacterium]
MEHMTLGLQLLVVGMLTVFAILLIVIFGGKLLISLVNMIAPEEVVSAKKKVASANTDNSVDSSTMAILQEVVKQITGGKGRVESAKKV